MEKTVQAWQKPEGQGPPRGVKLGKDCRWPPFCVSRRGKWGRMEDWRKERSADRSAADHYGFDRRG